LTWIYSLGVGNVDIDLTLIWAYGALIHRPSRRSLECPLGACLACFDVLSCPTHSICNLCRLHYSGILPTQAVLPRTVIRARRYAFHAFAFVSAGHLTILAFYASRHELVLSRLIDNVPAGALALALYRIFYKTMLFLLSDAGVRFPGHARHASSVESKYSFVLHCAAEFAGVI
jgi:hypothetical protein